VENVSLPNPTGSDEEVKGRGQKITADDNNYCLILIRKSPEKRNTKVGFEETLKIPTSNEELLRPVSAAQSAKTLEPTFLTEKAELLHTRGVANLSGGRTVSKRASMTDNAEARLMVRRN
jgi:hypothetical protein